MENKKEKDWVWDKGNVVQQQKLVFREDNTVEVPQDDYKPAVVDENGNEAPETALELIKGGRFDAKQFHSNFKDNTKQVLDALLKIQSNDAPLKKGGDNIAFRCDAIIIQNRQNYTAAQNTLLDIILAKMSSRPEDEFYVITAKELVNQLPYADKTYIYKILSTASKELNRSPFIFEVQLGNGKTKPIELHWNEVLIYNEDEAIAADENTYLSFTPTDFFRVLTASSSIMHGAHYPIGVPAQISSRYARNIFYFLASRKNYKEDKYAPPGVFTISLDELQYFVQYPDSYRTTDIRRFVLDTAVKEINQIKGIDFSFTYEFIKTGASGTKKKITHVKFIISNTIEIKEKKVFEIEQKQEQQVSATDNAVLQILKGIELSETECLDVLKKYNENKRDLVFLTQAITSVVTTKDVKSKCALLCHIMDNGLHSNMSADQNMKRNTEKNKQSKNKFNNFDQRQYDYDDLEAKLLNSNPNK